MSEISAAMQNNIRSLQSAVSMVALKKSMNQDAQSAAVLIQDMQAANANVTPPLNGIGQLLNTRA